MTPENKSNKPKNIKKNSVDHIDSFDKIDKGHPKNTNNTKQPPDKNKHPSFYNWIKINFQTVVLFMTLIAYVCVSIDQGRKTREAISESKSSSEKELRAYISITEFKTESINSDSINISVRFSNNGLTPAYNVSNIQYILINGEVDSNLIKWLAKSEHKEIGFIGVGTGVENTFPIEFNRVGVENKNRIIAGIIPVFIIIHLTYIDVFKKDHFVQICVKSYPTKNIFDVNDKYNDAD